MPTDIKNNFVENLIEAGFERFVSDIETEKGRYDCRFNTKNGWMGVTIYHPYERFTKGDKAVSVSLERFGVHDIIITDSGVKKIPVNEKQIKCFIGGETVYENNYGVMPPQEIQEKLYAD